VGKSSLLNALKNSLETEKDILIVYINCRNVLNKSAFATKLVEEFLAMYEKKHKTKGFLEVFKRAMKDKILAAIRRIDKIGGSLGEIGEGYIQLREKEIDEQEYLEKAFDFIESFSAEKNKRTIAILGTGLDEKSIYPQLNLKLAQKILETGGVLISEYPPGTRGAQFTFPQRNRIISGMSLGVLVIEAKFGSGALITAKWTRKQRRKVFAVPGPLHSLNSRGPHLLIKKGASLVENADDILKKLNLPKVERKKLEGGSLEENLILKVLKKEVYP